MDKYKWLWISLIVMIAFLNFALNVQMTMFEAVGLPTLITIMVGVSDIAEKLDKRNS